MSPTIWTASGAKANCRRLRLRAWRVVEAQHVIATRKLVDSDAEQQLLEELIESGKPPLPPEDEGTGLHYLLSTPFRYPPLAHGSRFGRRGERGVFYASERLATAFAETAYYRLLFLAGSRASLAPVMVDLSAFRLTLASERAVDLTLPPFARHQAAISSPVEYSAAQRLGADMRRDGVELFRYRSARDREGGANLGAFTPRVFVKRRPEAPQSWHCVVVPERVEMRRRDLLHGGHHAFGREDFLVDGELPAPAP